MTLRDPDVCGTRRGYRAGCRCMRCRAANALYVSLYRHRKRTGVHLLGSRVSATRTHIVMKALRAEMSRRQLALRLRWYRNYTRIQRAETITLRTALKVQQEWRKAREGLETPALPAGQADIALSILNELGKH